MAKTSRNMIGPRRFLKDERGGVLIYSAFAIPLLLGVAGLAVDIASWHAHKRAVQTAADAAAIAGASELLRLIDSNTRDTDAATAAAADAALNGYVDPKSGDPNPDTLTVNIPPLSGDYQGATNSVEAIIRRPVRTLLAGMVFEGQAFVTARSVATINDGQYCMFALNANKPNAFKVSGGADMNMSCGVYVNSTASSPDNALSSPGNGCLNASAIRSAGSYNKSGCYSPKPFEGTPQLQAPNPFAGKYAPPPEASQSCDATGNLTVNNGETYNLPSGRHCGKITVQNGGELILGDGNHVFDKALTVHGQLHDGGGDGVTLYFPDDTGSNDAMDFAADAEVDLSAPTTGDLANVLIYVDENATGNVQHNLTAQSTSSLEGLIYMPSHDIKFSGGNATEGVLIVADEIDLSGQANVGNLSASPLITSQNEMDARLVE